MNAWMDEWLGLMMNFRISNENSKSFTGIITQSLSFGKRSQGQIFFFLN